MRIRRILLLALAALIVLVPSMTLYYVVATESGLQLLASKLNRRIGPVTITIEGATGSLAHGFRVEHLRFQHRLSDIDLHGVTGEMDFAPLLVQRVQFPVLRVDDADVVLLRNTATGGRPWKPQFLPRLLRIELEDVVLAKGSLTAVNGQHYEATNAAAAATVYPKQIRVHRSSLDLPELLLHVQGDGQVEAALPFGLEGNLRMTYTPQNLPQWQFATNFDGNLDRLPLQLLIDAPFHARVNGDATTLNSGWEFAGTADVVDLDLTAFGSGDALGIISGELEVTASAEGYRAKGSLTPAALEAGAFDVTFDGLYRARELTIRTATARHPPSGSRIATRGNVELTDDGPQLDLQGDWATFRWPLSGDAAFSSPAGRYTLRGTKPWQVTAEGSVVPTDFQEIPFTVTGALAGDRFDIASAELQVLQGRATLSGFAQWNPQQQWQVAGKATDINPASVRADVPGRLNFDFKAAGAPFGALAALDVTLDNLTGRLRGTAASGQGQIARREGSEDLHFNDVDVRFGSTRLQLDGGLGAERDLTFAIEADDLSLLDATARGKVSAQGRIGGTAAAPVVLLRARGTDFEWGTDALESLQADVNIDLGSGDRTEAVVQMQGLLYAGRKVGGASIALSGRAADQKISVDFEAAPVRGAITAQGAFLDGLWRGTVEVLRLEDNRNLHLTLAAPAALEFSQATLKLEELCMKGDVERVCVAAMRDAMAWSSQFSAEKLPVRALTAGLTQDVDYEGTIDLNGRVQGGPHVDATGELHAELNGAELVHRVSTDRVERLALGAGRIDASATAEAFNVNVSLVANDANRITGKLDGRRTGADWESFPIRGSLDLTTDGLGVLDIYVSEIDRATGKLRTDVSIGGTLGQPTFSGKLELRDTRIDVYQVNLSLRELTVDAAFTTDALDISGQSKLGEGLAKFNGKLSWKDREPFGNLHVEGENLRVVDVPEAKIHASPNLDFKIAGRRIDATGTVTLSDASLTPADLTNAVLTSNDEVMVGARPVDPDDRWIVVSDIQLKLGENVNVDTLGLTARLGGGIALRTDEAGNSRGQGELTVESGRYAALGRLLDITRGRLLFNNGPLGDPGIDLRAEKEFPDVVAGVNVRGTLRAPRMTFYSEPSIPQSQIASLILAGGSLESVQGNAGGAAARNDLLAQGGAILAQRLGSRVGIEDVSIESDLSNETSLVLGKYLSPRLYVSYGISLAEAINTLKLRYTIGDNWTLKTESGKEQSADIVYTIQRK